jgi:two-component system, LytTR family, sensor histidine kinase AgrC
MNKLLNIKKTITTVIVLNVIQIGIVMGFAIYEFVFSKGSILKSKFGDLNLLLGIVLGIIFINSFMMLRDAYILNQVGIQDEMIKGTLAQVEELNNTLRSQRHDFMNHLQVVYSLIELNEYPEAQNYLDRVYLDIQKINRVLKTTNPAINALLQAKTIYCEKRGIRVDLKITSQLKELPILAWEMCRILGNLIDNAVDALKEMKGERILEIEIYEDLKCYGFRIKNNGPAIPQDLLEKIFETNFTTKGSQGEGLGLAIVKELINNNQGEIKVASDEKMTVFEGLIPKILK